jgi:phage-related minor tail protein
MKKCGLTIDDLLKLVGASQFFKDNGFDVEEMLMTFSSYKKMEMAIASQEQLLAALRQRSLQIEQENKSQEELLAERRLKNSELDGLKEMGFGLKDLKILRNLITEIAAEKGRSIENNEAVRKFISDIEDHYDDYLRLRDKVSQLESAKSTMLAFLGASSRLGEAALSFIRRGGDRK